MRWARCDGDGSPNSRPRGLPRRRFCASKLYCRIHTKILQGLALPVSASARRSGSQGGVTAPRRPVWPVKLLIIDARDSVRGAPRFCERGAPTIAAASALAAGASICRLCLHRVQLFGASSSQPASCCIFKAPALATHPLIMVPAPAPRRPAGASEHCPPPARPFPSSTPVT